MTDISQRISIYTILQTAALAEQSFDVLLLVDHADPGAALGNYKWITPDLAGITTGTDHHKWLTLYFGQARSAARVMIGRWTGAGNSVQADALAAIMALDNDFWCVCELGGTDAQQLALAAAVEATKSKFCFLQSTATACDDPASTTDQAYALKALGYKRTALVYSEHTDQYGYLDAAITGTILPGDPGAIAFSWQKITGVYQSGKQAVTGASISLDATARAALEAKYCNYCETLSGINVIRKGVTVSNIPVNLIMGMDWMNSGIQGDVYSYMMNSDNPAFDNKTLGAIEGIVKTWLKKAVDKGIILDTVDNPIVYNFPLASSFSAATKATGTLTLSNCYIAKLNYPVQDIVIYGTWTL